MVDPTLTITIDRSGLPGSLADLIASAADDENVLGIVAYTEPPRQARVVYAESQWLDGATAIGATWQQSFLNFDVVANVTSEAQLRTTIAALRRAVSQFSFGVVTTVNGAAGDTWACDMGSVVQAPRTLEDLSDFSPVYNVSIPVYPIPGS